MLINCCIDNDINKNNNNVSYFIKGAYNWSVKWYINGEPAFIGYGDYIENISNFIKNGKNTFKLIAVPLSNSNENIYCDTCFVELTNNKDEKILFGSKSEELNLNKFEKSFEFYAKLDTTWIWEKTDRIISFSKKDKDIIIDKISDIYFRLKSNQLLSMDDIRLLPWEYKKFSLQKGIPYEVKNKIKSMWDKRYRINMTPKESLQFFIGQKLALVTADNIINIEPLISNKNKRWYEYIAIKKLYFIKLNDEWLLLNCFNKL
jgi:hypothetical protein